MKLTKINSIDKTRKQTFDITVEKNHNFFCNNHLIHNCSYTGEIGVLLINLNMIGEVISGNDAQSFLFGSKNAYTINPGDKIAQIIFEKIAEPEFEILSELNTTSRGAGGFGSTGK